jgi:hypothetical protein
MYVIRAHARVCVVTVEITCVYLLRMSELTQYLNVSPGDFFLTHIMIGFASCCFELLLDLKYLQSSVMYVDGIYCFKHFFMTEKPYSEICRTSEHHMKFK